MIPGALDRTALNTYLANLSTRCAHGWDRQAQQCPTCGTDWDRFVAILAASVRPDGSLHVNDVREKTRGVFEVRLLSRMWSRARKELLSAPIGSERSTDVIGRNSHRLEEFWEWLGDASERSAA